jgi:hypothetical protein
MKHFPLLYRFQAEDRYLIWISGEKDSVVVDAAGFVPSFRDLMTLRQYADLNHHSFETEEPSPLDLDWVATWTAARTGIIDCKAVLDAWNLFSDMAASITNQGSEFKRIDPQFPGVYRKLFWGNNLPSVTPEGKQFIPDWSAEEISSLAEVLTAGLDLFRSCVRSWPSVST